jgi:membrane-associated phospholipid phosphatase
MSAHRVRMCLCSVLLAGCMPAWPQASANPQPGTSESPNPLEDPRDRIYYPADTESVKPLARKLGGNILLDEKEIWLSPFHMNRGNAALWIGFGAVTAGLIASDHESSTLFENSRGQVRWGNNISKIGATYTLIPLAAGFYGFGVLADDPKAREVGVLGGEAMLDSLIVVEILKASTGRKRPNASKEPGQFFDGGNGFPSGHSIATWSFASLISHEYGNSKLVPVLAYGLAGVVSAARYTARQHYLSDVVVGGAMGWFIGRYVYRTHMDHALHKHGWLQPAILPQFDPGTRSYGVTLAFGQ